MAEPQNTVKPDSESSGEEVSSSAFTEIAIGIDVGTSQSSVAVWNGSEVELVELVKDLNYLENATTMRSQVSFKDEIPSYRFEAFFQSTIFNMKRLIGRVDTDPVVDASKKVPFLVQTLGNGVRPSIAPLVDNTWKFTTAEEVLEIHLEDLRNFAEIELKRAIRDVVVTYPVSFNRFQLCLLERACAKAGLDVVRLVPEPIAVALLYGQQQKQTSKEKIALIFNMGAGYTDVAVIATEGDGGVSQILAMAGIAIGGEDLLQNMMHYLLSVYERLFERHGVKEIEAIGLLRDETELAIRLLSYDTSIPFRVDLENGYEVNKVVDRCEFEEVNRIVFEECESLIKKCLQDAGVDVEDVDDVIVVGGCSYIPKVKNLVTTIFGGKQLYEGIRPLDAAVRGAAMAAAVDSGIVDPFGNLDLSTVQVTPHAIGIQANGNTFVPVIPRNTRTPVRKDQLFTTSYDYQTEALIVVYEGEGDEVEQNDFLGYFKIIGIPSAPKGVPEIIVSMGVDTENLLRVLAEVLMPGSQQPAIPRTEVTMPTIDDGHWCAEEALCRGMALVWRPREHIIMPPVQQLRIN